MEEGLEKEEEEEEEQGKGKEETESASCLLSHSLDLFVLRQAFVVDINQRSV